MGIELEIDLARNIFGRLKPALRKRIRAYWLNPTERGWEDVYCMIVGGDGWMTVWQAWIKLDADAPRSKPCDEPWPKWPDRDTFERILRFATH